MSSQDRIYSTDFAAHEEWLHAASGTLLHYIKVGSAAGLTYCVRAGFVPSLALLATMPVLAAIAGARVQVPMSDGAVRHFATNGVSFAPESASERVTVATLPAASPTNNGMHYFVTDDDGGRLVRSNGTTMEPVAASVNTVGGGGGSGITDTTWAGRGTGTAGQIKRITDTGNQANVFGVWDGARWQPLGGAQLINSLQAPIVSASSTAAQVLLPDIVLPADLMGIYGGVDFEALVELSGTPTGRTLQMAFGGSPMANDATNGTMRTFYFARHARNIGAANSQLMCEASQEFSGAYQGNVNRSPQRATIDTTAPVTITGGVAYTSATAMIATLGMYRTRWIAG